MGKCQYTAIGCRSKEIGRKLLQRKSRSRTHVTKIMKTTLVIEKINLQIAL